MKGLFIKDIMSVWKMMLFCIIGMIIMLVVIVPLDIIESGDSVIVGQAIVYVWLIIICGSMVPSSLIAQDERCGFDMYMMILPVDRRKAVLEKYLVTLVILGVFSVVGIVAIFMIEGGTSGIWKIVCVALPISLVANSIQILGAKLLGMESGIVSTIGIFSVMIVVLILAGGIIDSEYNMESILYNYRWVWLTIGVVIYVVMALISCNIKEEC